MNFQLTLFQKSFFVLNGLMFFAVAAEAAEWKIEPSITLRAQYNDNVRMLTDNPEGSTGYTLEPGVKFAAEEINLWDMAINAKGKATRFQDIEDADSDNAFFAFNGGKQTERSDWRLNTSFERNSNFDTDFDTENPDAGLLDDHTERKTASVSPSVKWNMSETSQIIFSLNSTDVAFDEVTSNTFFDYDLESASFKAVWSIAQNHQLGFTSSYSTSESPDANFSSDTTVLQLDYSYAFNSTDKFSFSFGGRRLDSLRTGVTVACTAGGQTFDLADVSSNGRCPDVIFVFPATPVLEDIENKDNGTVVNISYKSKTERASHSFIGGRTVTPSSFGGVQEIRSATYLFDFKNTERFSSSLIIDASESETISNSDSSQDRSRYRIEPAVIYKLNKNWNLSIRYRYIDQNLTSRDEDSTVNAVFVNLFLHWPKLATTY